LANESGLKHFKALGGWDFAAGFGTANVYHPVTNGSLTGPQVCDRRRCARMPLTLRLEAVPKQALVGFAILVVVKLGVLLAFGPASQNDTTDYVGYADAILSGEFHHVDLATDPMPITLRRPIGYPAVIAAAKIVAGSYWRWAVVLFQYAVSLWATVMVYRLARAFRLGVWTSLGIVAAQATAMQFVVDQALVTDSLTASTTTIAVCILGLIALRREPSRWHHYLGAGVLIAIAFLIRDVMATMAIGLVPLAVAAALVEHSRLRRLAACALVFLPLAATHVAYTEWNRARVGAPVVTSVSQAALLDALTEAAQYDPTIFSGSTPIDDVGRRILKKMQVERLGYEAEASDFLHREYGWDAIRMSHEVTLAYLRGWLNHPWAMIRHTFYHISETQLHQAVRPIETVRDVLLWNTGSSHDFGAERAVKNGNWWMIPAVIVNWLAMTASVFVFGAFLVVTPIRLVREGWTAETSVSIGIWCFYLVVGGLYATVHLEPRYLTSVVAGSIVVGVVNIVRVVELYRRPAKLEPARQKIA
jgi:Dolichyl-phosphate-mannose-protein mannosyltransferase